MERNFSSTADYKAFAKERLAGKWLVSVLVFLVAGLLGSSSGSLQIEIDSDALENLQTLAPELVAFLMPILTAIAVPLTIYSIARFIIGGAVELGQKQYTLDLIDGLDPTFERLFCHIRRIGRGLALKLLTGLFIVLWSLLLIIPGIVASYRYALAPYILAEDPNCTALEAISRSKELMRGNKAELFWLELTFFGWNLLNVLTLGILGLWLTPYIETTKAVFYRVIRQTEENPGSGFHNIAP